MNIQRLFLKSALILFLITFLFLISLDYVYRETTYTYLSDKLVDTETGEFEKTRNIFNFAKEYIGIPYGAQYADINPLYILEKSFGSCDQQANLMSVLVEKQGIDGRWIGLSYENRTASPHSVEEIYLEGNWRIFDPLYGFMLTNENNSVATREEICRNNKTFWENKKVKDLIKYYGDEKKADLKEYQKWYCTEPKITWGLISNSRDLKRKILNKISTLIAKSPFAKTYQDYYLITKIFALDNYAKARHFHIWQRYDKAKKYYLKSLEADEKKDDALYFLGILLCDKGDYEEGIKHLKKYIDKEEKTLDWTQEAYHFLGKCYEKKGDLEQAKKAYIKNLEVPRNYIALSLDRYLELMNNQ